MYYHPLTSPFKFYTMHRDRALSAWQVLIDAWLDGVDRQRGVQAEAAKHFCATQMDSVRTLFETTDMADFTARLVACADPAPLKIVEISARLGEIAADTQRQILASLGLHVLELNTLVARSDASLDDPPRKSVKGGLATRRRQRMA
ncbi:MAG: hypothetical protein ABI724_02940 [Betaproteobacteria bacterium]